MAVTKLPSGKYQTKIVGNDGRWLTKTFQTKREAESRDAEWKVAKASGQQLLGSSLKITLSEFFAAWFADNKHEASNSGWRKTQFHYYRDYIAPIIGGARLRSINPAMIGRVFQHMTAQGLSAKTQALVFGTLRKVFADAITRYQLLNFNPVLMELKPRAPEKEARYLAPQQLKKLLLHVRDKPFGLAIWIQAFLGLRVGEVMALQWQDVEWELERISVRRTWVRATHSIRDYPKGRKHHSHTIPRDLIKLLREASEGMAPEQWVIANSVGTLISYQGYFEVLKSYCEELEIVSIGTHGLRHSSASLYLSNGATKEDLKDGLFHHSSMKITEKYIHGWQSNIDLVASSLQLFEDEEDNDQEKKSLSIGVSMQGHVSRSTSGKS